MRLGINECWKSGLAAHGGVVWCVVTRNQQQRKVRKRELQQFIRGQLVNSLLTAALRSKQLAPISSCCLCHCTSAPATATYWL